MGSYHSKSIPYTPDGCAWSHESFPSMGDWSRSAYIYKGHGDLVLNCKTEPPAEFIEQMSLIEVSFDPPTNATLSHLEAREPPGLISDKYFNAVVKAFDALDGKKTKALLEFIEESKQKHKDTSSPDIDKENHLGATVHPATVLALMLANPEEVARDIVFAMPIDGVRNLMRCTHLAFESLMKKLHHLPAFRDKLDLPSGETHLTHDKPRSQKSYIIMLQRLYDDWRALTPEELREPNPTDPAEKKALKKEMDVFDGICRQVHAPALLTVMRPNGKGFVADWADVWAEVDRNMWELREGDELNNPSTFGKAVCERLAKNAVKLLIPFKSRQQHQLPHDLKWKQLFWILGPAYADLVVALDYLALSHYAGDPGARAEE